MFRDSRKPSPSLDRGENEMSDFEGILVLIGRLIFMVYFLMAGWNHVKNSDAMVGYARSMRFPVPAVGGWVTGVVLIIGGLFIGLGIWPDIGALLIGLFLLTAAAYFHRFWQVGEDMKMTQTFAFWRNGLGLAGCLIMIGFFAAAGEELRYSITAPVFG